MTPDQFKAIALLLCANFMLLLGIFGVVCIIARHIINK